MPDNLSPEHRRKAMCAVKSTNTSLEQRAAAAFKANGWRFRCNVAELPGKPDFVFARARLIVFVDGDFWHGWQFPRWRDKLGDYWQQKIARNRRRDQLNFRRLRRAGWTVLRFWGHDVERNMPSVVAKVRPYMKIAPKTITRRTSAGRSSSL